MNRNPKSWRTDAGLSLKEVAASAGIGGANPARTYQRYENGQSDAPARVIEAVRELSAGIVGAEDWQAVRVAFLNAQPAEGAPA